RTCAQLFNICRKMTSTSSKSSKSRRSSILKIRQTTVDAKVDVVEQPKNRRRVSFHHQKSVKEYDKEKHELSATSPLKESVKEAMSDFDSTKSNSTLMSLGTPDRTTGDHTMNLFKGMMAGGNISSVHHESKDMSFSIIEDPANTTGQNDTLNVMNGMHTGHISIHSKSVDISYRMEESVNENGGDNTMDIFGRPSANQSTRGMSNTTMDMDISKADNTLTDGVFEGDDTMAIFGVAAKKVDTSIPLDNTMNIFTSGSGGSDKSRSSQSILMDMSANPTPPSSQDKTMAIFGMGSQSNESIAMEEVTMLEEEKESQTISSKSPLHSNHSKILDETQSPDHNDTMAMFTFAKTEEVEDEDVPIEMSMTVNMKNNCRPSSQDEVPSPTMNVFKRKGDDEIDDDLTMNVFGSKRWREEGDITVGDSGEEGVQKTKESQETPQELQKSVLMDEEDATMNVFGVKMDETGVEMVDDEESNGEKKDDQSILEISTKTAVEGSTEQLTTIPINSDRTFDCFNGLGDTSQMDLTGRANSFLDGVKTKGDVTEMDMSREGDETLAEFGMKDEEEEKNEDEVEQNETFVVKENEEVEKEDEKKEKSINGSVAINQSIIEDNSIPSDNRSDDMMEETPPPSQSPVNGVIRKTRLSTVIEVSSRYTAASSQSMRQRVESTEDESKDEGILDRMDHSVNEVEEGKEIYMEEKSGRMEDESMVDSASPSDNNTTFSATLTKRNMLDETRLSDRSMMNITRPFDELVLEKIEWMRRENEGGEIDGILKEHANDLIEETVRSIHKSESALEDLIPQINQLEKGDLLAKSIMKLNSIKVQEYRYLFEWARREAQKVWWEKRAETAEKLNEELERRMMRDEEELKTAKEDVIMMAKLNDLKEDVENLSKEVKMGRGLSRNTIDELIGASKRKEEEKERLERQVTKMELENMRQSTMALKIMAERRNDIDESIKRKMEERDKNKRELRAYLSQLANNLK
ncbi:hypothetical protein PRIPAC_88361, partial [Pristionchus pacificus]